MKTESLRNLCCGASAALLVFAGSGALTTASADWGSEGKRADWGSEGKSSGQSQTQGATGATGSVDDATLARKVRDAFIQDDAMSASRISVTSTDGVVQLSGFASSEEEADRAERMAREVPGVQEVRNNITVQSSSTPMDSQYPESQSPQPETQQ